MKISVVRGLAACTLILAALPGCTSKRQQLQIKKLEATLEEVESELAESTERLEKELQAKDEELRKLESDSSNQINDLTIERDKLANELTALKRKVERAEAERVARLPKEASDPGHADFDPARETKFTHALATITGDASSGSGFIVVADGKRYLYTAAATLTGNSKLTITTAGGEKLTKFGSLETAEDCPFIRLELLDADALPALEMAERSTAVGSDTRLSCLSIATDSGTVSGEMAQAFGQSEDAIDMDPNLLVGKAGGPVLNGSTGKLLGMVVDTSTERTDLWEDSATAGEIPLRVTKINRDITWQAVPIGTFLGESRKIAEFDRLTKVALALAAMTPSPEGLGVDTTVSGTHTVKSILTDAKDFPPAVEAATLHTQLVSKKARLGGADLKKRVNNLFGSALGQLQRGADAFDASKFSPYHRKRAEKSLGWRKDAVDRLKNATESDS